MIPKQPKQPSYERRISPDATDSKQYFEAQFTVLSDALGMRKSNLYKEVAQRLATSTEMLRKRLNGSKPPTRDFIFALCIVLRMSEDSANCALSKYDMPGIDANRPREEVLAYLMPAKDSLLASIDEMLSIEDINQELRAQNHLELAMQKRRSGAPPPKELPYRIVERTLCYYYDEGDRCDSLETQYKVRNECGGRYILEDSNGQGIMLSVFPDGTLYKDDYPYTGFFPCKKRYETPEDSGDFKDYYVEMLQAATKEQRKINEYLDDTRNFVTRFSADLVNDTIHIFYETFSYGLPVLQEFYLMELRNGHFRLTVSSHSMFMRTYLDPKEYAMQFHGSVPVTTVYESLEELEKERDKTSSYYDEMKLNERIRAYRRSQQEILVCLRKLQNREIFIRNLSSIFWASSEVCRYYNVEEEYECTTDSEDNCVPQKDNATFADESGELVTVSLEELERSFELGYQDIAQIVRIKHNSGTVEAVLALDEQ